MKIKFTAEISIEDSIVFEKVYPENLQWDAPAKQELKDDGVEFMYMVNAETNELIGEVYYIALDKMKDWDADEEQLDDGLEPYYDKNMMYCFSNTILPKFQKQGYGKILKAWFLGYSKGEGFELTIGHARPEGSLQLNESFGAEVVRTFETWYGLNENVYLYLQKL